MIRRFPTTDSCCSDLFELDSDSEDVDLLFLISLGCDFLAGVAAFYGVFFFVTLGYDGYLGLAFRSTSDLEEDVDLFSSFSRGSSDISTSFFAASPAP